VVPGGVRSSRRDCSWAGAKVTTDAVPGSGRGAGTLYRQYGPLVYRRCLRLLRDREAAKDATQEVFMKLVRDIPKLEERATLLPWMYRVATNHCLNLLRDSKRRGEESVGPDLVVASTTPKDVIPDRVLAHRVLSSFDAATQAVAIGIIVDGRGYDEVAAALGISRRTVGRMLKRFVESARGLRT
jgi:RNA polymerase sigma-70 factor (ECF subfamily)